MRTSILLLQDVPWKTLRERALRADELGFDAIWVADHLVNPYEPQRDWLEAWTALGALAATTSHARRFATFVSSDSDPARAAATGVESRHHAVLAEGFRAAAHAGLLRVTGENKWQGLKAG